MPQMAPMSWMILYLYFMMLMMMFMTKMYFNMTTKTTIEFKEIKMNKYNWKW
uniref:ATP synthase F0 subunit 8 n=1 Tax=Sungaya inexpectata TaxID=202437 RepID=UPI0025A9B42C|nr:ATP synthase F0 subunit 8 [Sungaya inexpectata]WID87019.1 ATP synthase F0 subunit 8 [Sungaya inexpectata]